MTNRQDRRFAAKLARQAARRGKTPTERALLVAAAAYSAEQPMEIDFAIDGLDAAWARLEPEFWDILGDAYPDFRREVFADATWGPMVLASTSGQERGYDIQPILLPATGDPAALLAFVEDAGQRRALAASLRESGVFPEEALLAFLPAFLAPEAVDLHTVGPAAAFRLTLGLAELLALSPDADVQDFAQAGTLLRETGLPLQPAESPAPLTNALLLGAALTPADDIDLSDDEAEARRLAMAATRASWLDTYAADLAFRLDEPVLWHEAGASLAWHAVSGAMDTEIARIGGEDRVTQLHACLLPEEGDTVLVARVGETYVGPFRASKLLVATDVDGFAGLAKHFGGELVEHERPEPVLRLVGS